MSLIDTVTIPARPAATATGRHRLDDLGRSPIGWVAVCTCHQPDGDGDGRADFHGDTPEEAVSAWIEHEEGQRPDRQRQAQAGVLGEQSIPATVIRRADGQFLLIVADAAVVLDAAAWAKLRTVR